eukprot:jgi/Mesen1/10895/ME000095S10236
MAAGESACFDETSAVMAQLIRVFDTSKEKDAQAIRDIQNKHNDILKLCASREEQMQEMLNDLQKAAAAAKERATPSEDEGVHEQRVKAAEGRKRGTLSRILDMQAQAKYPLTLACVTQLGEHREALQEQAASLEERRAQLESLAKKAMPRTLYELSLYAHVSRIQWDYADMTRAKGYISKPEASDVSTFDFDPSVMSAFELNNRLWELID